MLRQGRALTEEALTALTEEEHRCKFMSPSGGKTVCSHSPVSKHVIIRIKKCKNSVVKDLTLTHLNKDLCAFCAEVTDSGTTETLTQSGGSLIMCTLKRKEKNPHENLM